MGPLEFHVGQATRAGDGQRRGARDQRSQHAQHGHTDLGELGRQPGARGRRDGAARGQAIPPRRPGHICIYMLCVCVCACMHCIYTCTCTCTCACTCMFLVGGQDGDTCFADVLQFNMGGFVMQFDGIDDEIMVPMYIMVPHLSTLLPLPLHPHHSPSPHTTHHSPLNLHHYPNLNPNAHHPHPNPKTLILTRCPTCPPSCRRSTPWRRGCAPPRSAQ